MTTLCLDPRMAGACLAAGGPPAPACVLGTTTMARAATRARTVMRIFRDMLLTCLKRTDARTTGRGPRLPLLYPRGDHIHIPFSRGRRGLTAGSAAATRQHARVRPSRPPARDLTERHLAL